MLIASLIRYDAISMDKSANQAALPRRLMATLQVRSAADGEMMAVIATDCH